MYRLCDLFKMMIGFIEGKLDDPHSASYDNFTKTPLSKKKTKRAIALKSEQTALLMPNIKRSRLQEQIQ